MTWETYQPMKSGSIRAGQGSLSKNGQITLLFADLAKAGFEETDDRVVVLMDKENKRIALRKQTHPSEASLALNVANDKRTLTYKVQLWPAIKQMGLVLTEATRCPVVVNETAGELVILLPLETKTVRAKPMEKKP